MAYDVPQLFTMSHAQLDELFTNSLPGEIPNGEGKGTAIVILPFGLNAIIAKVYKGPSWLDSKECIILDYSETSLIAHWIRDEIRQIEPHLYLGKVYWGKKRLIDFALQF